MDYALKNYKPTEVFDRNNIQPIFSMFLLHNKSVLRYLLYYVHLYHVLTLSLPSRAISIIFHYPASLCYAGLIVKSLVCIMSTISILCLHNCHVINNIRSNVDSSSPNGSLLCRMSPSRTELFVYFFKLIPVYYYEYACVCERVDSICMSDWWGDCGGGFTSTREDVNGVEYQVVGSGRVSRNTHVQLIFITPYYFDISIVYKHLHIIFHIFISLKWLTMGLLKILTYSSITMVTPEYHFFSFFYYYVVIKFKCLFIDLCLFYSISSCTCMIIMTSYTVIYMFLNVLLIVSGSYITCIHVQSHYVLKGKLSVEGGSSASRVYQTYTYNG